MPKKSHPTVAIGFLLLLIVAVGGCKPDKATQSADKQRSAQGSVTVRSSDADQLTQWTPPAVTVDLTNPDEAIKHARTALEGDNLFADGTSAVPVLLALSNQTLTEAEKSEVDRLLQKSVQRLIEIGISRIPYLDENPAALAEADMITAVVRVAAPGDPKTFDFLDRMELALTSARLNAQAIALVDKGDLGDSPDQGAQQAYREVLKLDPSNATAKQGLANIESLMIIHAQDNADQRWYNLAAQWLRRAAQVRPDEQTEVNAAKVRIEAHRTQYIESLRATALMNLPKLGGLKSARTTLVEMLRVADPGDPVVANLRTRIDLYEHYGDYRPGQVFTDVFPDGGRGPAMVVIPHGAFVMGAHDNDPNGQSNEKPAHDIRFAKGFALAQNEVTVAEFGRFINATKHRTRASRRGFSSVYSERTGNFAKRSYVDWYSDFHGSKAAMNAPVMHVGARDAQAYVKWLSEVTGKNYRLPSEAEFEYANRAGSTDVYPWGPKSPAKVVENLTGLKDVSVSGRRWQNGFMGYGDGWWGPAPVRSFKQNNFGVYDMGGNLSEWTADCIHSNFRRAPADGKAWENPGCRTFVVKGGSWASSPEQARSAYRAGIDAETTNTRIGFRVARDL